MEVPQVWQGQDAAAKVSLETTVPRHCGVTVGSRYRTLSIAWVAPQTRKLLLDLGGSRQIWVPPEQVLELSSRGLWFVPAQMDLGQ